MIKLKDILNEQQTKTVKGVEYWRKGEGEPWEALEKCVKGNCHHGQGETISDDGSFIGEFKNGKRYHGVLTGPKGDQIYANGKATIVREPEEREGGILATIIESPFIISKPFWFSALPSNAKAFINSLIGSKKTITAKDFSINDLLVLIEVVKRVKREGRNYLTYSDYKILPGEFKVNKDDPDFNPEVNIDPYARDSTGYRMGGHGRKDDIWSSFDDTTKGAIYRLHTTLGNALIRTDKDGNTIIVDEYNHNQSAGHKRYKLDRKASGKEVKSDVEDIIKILNYPNMPLYSKLKKIAVITGEEEGAHVYINLGDEANI
tara:strand:+ start:345 stop:1298 length:954 start_codon:yes stop_codon:yes gene_type:complete